MPRLPRSARRLALAALGLVLGLVAVELGHRGWLRLSGKPYDAGALLRELAAASQTLAGAAAPGAPAPESEDWDVLEPYFGADTWRGMDELFRFYGEEVRPEPVSV